MAARPTYPCPGARIQVHLFPTLGTCAKRVARTLHVGVLKLQHNTLAAGVSGRIALSRFASFSGRTLPGACTNGHRWRAQQWLENSAEVEVGAPVEEAWALWEQRERIPEWMAWITSVKVLPEDPRLSRWTLSTQQFGRAWEFSWLAQNLTPVKHQKIHWRSVEGSSSTGIEVANRGQIRFYKRSPDTCAVKLTISYEVPNALAPFGNALTPLVESILKRDLDRFAVYAKQQESS